MRRVVYFILIGLSLNSSAQVISEFNWNSGSVSTAVVGPDAVSVSSSAVVDNGGANATTGLNAGTPKKDIDMVLTDSLFENLEGIDFKIDFQRDESRGDFITCGSTFAFGVDAGELFVSFEIDDNIEDSVFIQEYNLYEVPDDDKFRTYRFYYLPADGTATVTVDDSVVWSNTYSSQSPLIWPNQDVLIGKLMDGNGLNKTIIDNVIIAEVYDSALPVELTKFNVSSNEHNVILEWETASESNNDFFTIERSKNGDHYYEIATIQGAGSSNDHVTYKYVDKTISSGTYYYRLQQTDFNGKTALLGIRSIVLESTQEFKIHPTLIQRGETFQVSIPNNVVINSLQIRSIDGLKSQMVTPITKHSLTVQSPREPGIYLVCLKTDKSWMSRKIVVR